jgi:hypothetical protein
MHSIVELESEYMQWELNPILVNLPEKQEVAIFIPTTGGAACFSLKIRDAE